MPTERMIVNYAPGQDCRVALTLDDKLEELHTERADAVPIVGNIYVGRVNNVERSIQAAFVDFGHGINGFLHVSDLHPQYFPGNEGESERVGMKTPRRERPPIEKCLKKGQKIIVQVLKDNISTKGPTLTSYISLPGRYLVMLPDMDKVGVSRKVEDEDQRRAMRKILDGLDLPEEFGFILRTAGMDRTKTELKRDLAYLMRLWKDIDKRLKHGDKPRLLYAESDLLMRALRDIWTAEISEIVIDDPGALRRASAFMRIVAPRSKTKLLDYDLEAPIFHAFGIEQQIELIHAREVPLPSGGSLIIDEAEAMVAIDVNSGKSRRHGDAETTAYKTNIEAVDEITRQIKLRDVGGLIMCDLIDMSKRSNRKDIEKRMDDALKRDRASTKALPISQFGIVEMTRQRVRGSFKSTHFKRINLGDGHGWMRKAESIAQSAVRQLSAIMTLDRVQKAELVVPARVASELLSTQRNALTKLEIKHQASIEVRVSDSIPADRVQFYAYDDKGDVNLEKAMKFTKPTDLGEYKAPGSEDEDWAQDSASEHDETLEELVHEEEQAKLDEALALEAELLEIDDDDEEESGSSRRRRRGGRRRRGRRGRGQTEGELADGADNESRSDESDAEADADSSDERSEESGQGRRRRRGGRRRGRGGRGRSSEGAAGVSPEDAKAIARAKARALAAEFGDTAPSGYPWRGDSWDIEPSELTMGDEPGTFNDPELAAVADQARVIIESSEAPRLEHDDDAPEDAGEDADAERSYDEESADGEGVKKKRRRRRGGRKHRRRPDEESESGAEHGSEVDENSGESSDRDEAHERSADGDSDEDRPRRRRRGRRGGRSRRREEGEDTGASAEPQAAAEAEPKPRRAPRPRRATESAEPKPALAPAPATKSETEASPAARPSRKKKVGPRKGKVAPKDLLIGADVSPASGSKSSAPSKEASTKKMTKKKVTKKKVTKKVTKKTTTKKATTKKTTKKRVTKKAASAE